MASTRTKTGICNMALDILNEGPITGDVDTATSSVAKWFQRNYQEYLDAELRDAVWKFALKRRRLWPRDYILKGTSGDVYGTLTGAWGLERLVENFQGDVVKIRRSSDDTTDDFGFDEESQFHLDEGGIATFVGSGTAYIQTLYDQSSLPTNQRNITQATTTKQPLLSLEEEESGLPCASFDGVDDFLASSGWDMSASFATTTGWLVVAGLIDTATLDSSTATSNHLLAGALGQTSGLYVRKNGTLYAVNNDGTVDRAWDGVPLLVPFVAAMRRDATTIYLSVNGRAETTFASGTTSSLASLFQIGDVAGSNALDFKLFAAMLWTVPPVAQERTDLIERLMRWCSAGGAGHATWDYHYPMPTDCLKMLPIREDGEFEGAMIPHEIEGDYILTDYGPYIDSRYVWQISDPTRFDVLFTKALAGSMAEKLANWLTGKTNMVQVAAAFRAQALSDAKRANAIEGTPEKPYADDAIMARYRS